MAITLNEVVAGRNLLAYQAPFLAGNAFPTDAAWGTAPGAPYVDVGATKDGLHVQWRMQWQEYTIDQQLDPVAFAPQDRDLRSRANLGQIDMADLVVATGQGTATSVAAATGVRGKNTFTINGTVDQKYYTIFYDAQSPVSGEAARFAFWKQRAVGDIAIDMHVPDLAQINLEMRCIPDDSVTPARIAQFVFLTPAL